jgi:hypothetical protein
MMSLMLAFLRLMVSNDLIVFVVDVGDRFFVEYWKQ